MKKAITLIALFITIARAHANPPLKAAALHKMASSLTAVLVHDVYSPPVASRVYLYAFIAAYESIVAVDSLSGYQSLRYSISGFPLLNVPDESVDAELTSTAAFYFAAKKFVFSEKILEDSFILACKPFNKIKISDSIKYNRSIFFGKIVADSIIAWSSNDNYSYTRKLKRYTYLKQAGKWVPTPPAYIAAIEPYWSKMRTVSLDSAQQCATICTNAFNADTSSGFYKEAVEVYRTGLTLTAQQKNIANFWDCNPFNVNTSGHMLFATKKLSPGGHWINIAMQVCLKTKASLAKSAAAYVYTAIALYDGFIGCWFVKYRDNLIRPETFINTNLDASWKPLLQTPPFPEYPSGHSVISTSAAIVLTHFFGDSFSFNDITEMPYGLPARRFTSFNAAAKEAAISRLYGGIHYRSAIEDGQVMGKKIGETVLVKIILERPK